MIDKLWAKIQLKRDYADTFSTPHGQRVLKHLLKVSGATVPKFTADPDRLRWNEAQRHFALSIFQQVHGSMDQMPDLLAEQLKATEDEKQNS